MITTAQQRVEAANIIKLPPTRRPLGAIDSPLERREASATYVLIHAPNSPLNLRQVVA